MTQNDRRRRRQDDEDTSTQVAVQTKTRRQESKTTLERGLSAVEEEEEEETLYAREPARATKKTKAKAVKETKFEGIVQKDRAELRGYLQSCIADIGNTDTQFRNQMKTHLTSLDIPVLKAQASHAQDEFNSMLDTVSRLFEASSQIDTDFRSMATMAESVEKELKREDAKNAWEEDKKTVVQLLEKGMKISMKRIDQLIPEAAKAGKQASSIDISSEISYNEVSDYFTNTHPQEKRLRETLAQATKGVKRIVRFLPEQEDI